MASPRKNFYVICGKEDERMVYHVYSMGLSGIEGYRIKTECCITQGLPAFDTWAFRTRR